MPVAVEEDYISAEALPAGKQFDFSVPEEVIERSNTADVGRSIQVLDEGRDL
jgi:hypothetical protein